MRILIVISFLVFSFSLGKAQNDSLYFENYATVSNNGIITIDSLTGNWQIGQPNKINFTSAFSGNIALVTDTINSPIDQTSFAYFSIDLDLANQFASGNQIAYFCFHHWLNNPDYDYLGYVEVWNNNQWENIHQYLFTNYYMLDYDNNYYLPFDYGDAWSVNEFSEETSGWVETCISFHCISMISPVEENRGINKMNFRFRFENFSNPNFYDGWIIDNLFFKNFMGSCPGSINENESYIQLSVSPTLSNGNISFETESELFSKISIYDFSGKLIENFSFIQTNFKTLELSNLSNGMYFYSVEDGKATGKFMMEK